MIKFMSTTHAGRKLLGLMITDENVEKLKKNQPIHFHAEEMGLTDINCNEILIMHYPSDEEFRKAFERLITDETKIHIVEREEQ